MGSFLRRFFISQEYFSTLSFFFAVYLIVTLTSHFTDNIIIKFIQIAGGLFFLIFGTGMGSVLILQWIFKRKFDLWEFISLSLISSLLFLPIILNLEFALFKKVDSWYPLANILILWCTAGTLLFLKKTSLPVISSKLSLKNPLLIVLLLSLIFTAIQILSFKALPDLDPYKWLFKYTYQFENHLLDTYERPLFGSFIYIGTALTNIEIFNFFKYVLPFFFSLVLFPAWMVARNFRDKNKQRLFLLFVFTSPVTILYAETAMPQMPLIIISYFFTFFLLYSAIKKDHFFLYASGILMFLAFFYHQAAFIIFIAWMIPVIITKRKALFSNKTLLLLTVAILFFNLHHLRTVYAFAEYWIKRIIPHFFKENNINLLYPAQYINTDNQIMGWNSVSGVIKFYSFYVGPLIGLVLAGFIFLLFQKKFRSYISKRFKNNTALFALISSFVAFFIIAEIFPRFPNIALLPDRAWIFCGIFFYIFLFLILNYIQKISFKNMVIFLLFFAIGISGTIYINYLKRYLISPMQLESAEWIKKHLPNNRVFLSFGHRSLLPVHAGTPFVRISPNVYCTKDIQEFYEAFDNLENNSKGEKNKITVINPLEFPVKISRPIMNENIYSFNFIYSLENKPIYVYYSRLHLKNPYRERSYGMASWGMEPCPDGKFLFDDYPEKFERIYYQKDLFDEVAIWKILDP